MIVVSLGAFLDADKLALYATRQKFGSTPVSVGEVFQIEHDPFSAESGIQTVSDCIRQFCARNSFKPANLTFGIGRKKYFWSLVEMPPVGRADLFKLFQYEIEMHVPAQADEIIYDVLPLDIPNTTNSKVMLVSTSKAIVIQLGEMANRAGVKLHAIEMAITALQRLINGRAKTKLAMMHGIIFRYGRLVELAIVKNGELMASHVIWGESDDQLEVNSTIAEFHVLLLSLDVHGSLNQCDRLFLAGDFSVEWIASFKEAWVGGDVIDLRDIHNESAQSDSGPLLCAKGLSLATTAEHSQFLNLLPQAMRPIHRHTGLVLTGVFTGLLLASSIVALANSFWNTQYESRWISHQIDTLESRVQEVLDINKQFSEVRKDFELLRSISRDYPSQLDVLREVTRVMPSEDSESFKKAWLESYSRNDILVTLTGQSESPEGLITILEDSDFFEKVRFDGNVAGQKFTIKAMLSRTMSSDAKASEEGDLVKDEPDSESTPTLSSDTSTNKPSDSDPSEVKENRDKGKNITIKKDESFQESEQRGPAFPRERESSSAQINPAPTPQNESPSDTNQRLGEEKSPEDIEQMKNNLFDFIKKHKEEGNVVERERNAPEPDSEEAAANFLEFLKSAADNQNAEQKEGHESN